MANNMKRYSGHNHGASGNSIPYPSSRLAPAMDIVDLAREISQADDMIQTATTSRLRGIAEQIQRLQQDAHQLLQQARQDQQLHRARCNFKREVGRTYHLYARPGGQSYFSMLSPDDWAGQPPHAYQGSWRLEADMSWTAVEEIEQLDEKNAAVRQLLDSLPSLDKK